MDIEKAFDILEQNTTVVYGIKIMHSKFNGDDKWILRWEKDTPNEHYRITGKTLEKVVKQALHIIGKCPDCAELEKIGVKKDEDP